jgi:hypothetical protein
MVRTIVGDLKIPTGLQFALSQRLYSRRCRRAGCSGRATTRWRSGSSQAGERRHYLMHWAVWDTGR